jgi:hypothetical protein
MAGPKARLFDVCPEEIVANIAVRLLSTPVSSNNAQCMSCARTLIKFKSSSTNLILYIVIFESSQRRRDREALAVLLEE